MQDLQIVIPAKPHQIDQCLDPEILVAFLRQAGFQVSIAHAGYHEQGLRALLPAFYKDPPRVLYWHLPSPREFRLLEECRTDLAHRQDPPLRVAGGYFAGFHDRDLLARFPWLDIVIRGELELPILALLHKVQQGRSWQDCPGITRRNAEDAVYATAPGPLEHLDSLPAAADDLFHPDRRKAGQQVLFNRGCRSDCQYCGFQWQLRRSYPPGDQFWRSRKPHSIVDEIEFYASHHGVRFFQFFATVFFGYDERGTRVVEDVAREILRRGLDIGFRFVSHPQHLVRNRSLLPLLKEAGLRSVHLGIDSGSVASLERFRVEFGREDNLQALEALHTEGVAFTPGFIFYEPWMTLDEVDRQLAFLGDIQPFFDHMKQTYPFFLERHLLHQVLGLQASIPITESLRQEGLLREPEHFWEAPRAQFRQPETGAFFRIHRQAHDRFLAPLRPLLWNRRCVEVHPRLTLLPVHLLQSLLDTCRQGGSTGEEQIVEAGRDWLHRQLGDDLPAMLDTAGLEEDRRTNILAVFRR